MQPLLDYTPFGYLDNPYHSAVLNRSGILRSVPPIGFGFWCRKFPWPYGEGARRNVNYMSLLHLSLSIGGISLHTSDDFEKAGIRLVSRYHTKSMMSYDWEHEGLTFSAKYFQSGEHSLVCVFEGGPATLHATHIYGYNEQKWWGSDGVATTFEDGAAIGKIWAYGDVFALGADREPDARKATASREEWNDWIAANDMECNDGASVELPNPLYSVLSYRLQSGDRLILSLTRGVNSVSAIQTHRTALATAMTTLDEKLREDRDFYAHCPLLTGDWPDMWKEGWVHDLETLRMTIRPPLGIYHHPWDGMQIYTPRCVLGETMLDAQALSYAVPELAKEVIYGTFADAPMPNVPCSREDGSMNMIGAGGAECGTAPTWGMPFTVIRALYLRDGDKEWLGSLYPYLQSFLEWWLENRTDADGWFHCNNSWESGQDGSKRFLVGEAQVADFVRTVDVEAVMASAMANMAWFAEELGLPADRWQTLAEERVERTRAMFVDGWFRDFDGRTGEPILLEDYWDIMMLVPLAVGIATPEQIEAVRPRFEYFRKNPSPFLEWPSFLFPATEAAWNAGLREWAAEVVADTGNRIYARTTRRAITKLDGTGLPEPYNYRIPGVQSEFWPIEPPADIGTGAECYGWGATLPTLVIRNIFGFREGANGDEFLLAPSLPAFATPGMSLGISNLRHRDLRFDLACTHSPEGSVNVRMTARCDRPVVVTICTGDKELASARLGEKPALIHFQCANSEILRVSLDSRTAEGKTGS